MMRSKISHQGVQEACVNLLKNCAAKPRNFVQSIDIQIGLKDIDVNRDKRFNGQIVVPHATRKHFPVAVFGDMKLCEAATAVGLKSYDLEAMKAMKGMKKVIKKMVKSHKGFFSSPALLAQIPRLLGPSLNRAGKFPMVVAPGSDLLEKRDELSRTVKFQMKKVLNMSATVGNTESSADELAENIVRACNYLVTLTKKGWNNIKSITVKSTMGAPIKLL